MVFILKIKKFAINQGNPGVGGTHFVSIMLALNLAEDRPDYNITILSDVDILIIKRPENLRINIVSIDEVFSFLDKRIGCVFITSRGIIKKFLFEKGRLPDCIIIAWIHHSYVFENWLAHAKVGAYVSVGEYQYYSHDKKYFPHWHIPNIITLDFSIKLQKNKNLPLKNEYLNIVFLGALIHCKGFHELAKQFIRIRNIHPLVRLHVIGSTGTYGLDIEDEIIPTNKEYANLIRQYITDEDIRKGRVIFYGNMGSEKFDIIKQCHFAILNPSGFPEAFMISQIECMACGVPVIASDDYGVSDVMRFFPELSLAKPEFITDKIAMILSNPLLYEELTYRAIIVAQYYASQTKIISKKWQRLIEELLIGDKVISEKPISPRYGSYLKMRYRQVDSNFKISARLYHLLHQIKVMFKS
jgi:glycosyltransferase involved in cell wall biosynthesis